VDLPVNAALYSNKKNALRPGKGKLRMECLPVPEKIEIWKPHPDQ
jgi:hypothetical protein